MSNNDNQRSNPFYNAQNRLDGLAIVFSVFIVSILITLMYALPITMLLCLCVLIAIKYQDKQTMMKYYPKANKDNKHLSGSILK